MIDTVGVRFPIAPTRKQLRSWVSTHVIFPDGRRKERYKQNIALETGARVGFEYYPRNAQYREHCLKIWFSVPKALFGENVSMVERDGELHTAIGYVNEHLNELQWLPAVDIRQGFLYRMDSAYNHQVGDRMHDYISALFHLKYSRRKTKPYHPAEGVMYKGTLSTTSFYNKYEECKLPEAVGILRQETQLRKNYHIGSCIKVEEPTLGDIQLRMNEAILKDDLSELGLYDTITVNREQALDILIETYGFNNGTMLYGHWLTIQSMSRKQMLKHGAVARTIRERNSRIVDAGLSLTVTEGNVPLPALRIY